jgi:tetratricopeptide (TPR) repeat protein
MGVRPTQGRFLAWLSEACLTDGAVDRAEALAHRSLVLNREAAFPYGVALAQRALGAAVGARGQPHDAMGHLEQALAMFESMSATYEAARTRLSLAELTLARGRPDVSAAYAGEAARVFESVGTAVYAARARRLEARATGSPEAKST